MATPNRHHAIPEEILDDISSRFIINVPDDERCDITRMMFQIELAHWFYIDLFCEEISNLPKLSFKQFSRTIFAHVPFLRNHLDQVDVVLDDFRTYKSNVPTYGAIILDQDLKNCLMVQGFWAKSSWGFPKGKVNHSEDPKVCAIREVNEETGFDCTPYISEEYIERSIRGTTVRLYIVPGVSPDEKFSPKTRNEIKDIRWFDVSNLPSSKDRSTGISNTNAFFMAVPFVQPLRSWIAQKQRHQNKRRKRDPGEVVQAQPPLEVYDLKRLIEEAQRKAQAVAEPHVEPTVRRFGTTKWDNVRLDVDWHKLWSGVRNELSNNSLAC